MSKVLIGEEILDNLLLKSLPPEYEVLLGDDALGDDEEEYYYFLLLILNGQIDTVKEWVSSDEFEQLMEDVENLPLDFFDKVEFKLKEYTHDKFELLLLPLLLGFYTESNKLTYQSLNITPVMTNDDVIRFVEMRQYNYDLLTNLGSDMHRKFKDIILDGVINKKSVNDISNELELAGVQPLNRHTAQQRAKMIARTEVTNIKNKARLQAYNDNGIMWVDIVTMGDDKVCSICRENEENNPYTLEEAETLVPSHPSCRCLIRASDKNFDEDTSVSDFESVIDDESLEYIYE